MSQFQSITEIHTDMYSIRVQWAPLSRILWQLMFRNKYGNWVPNNEKESWPRFWWMERKKKESIFSWQEILENWGSLPPEMLETHRKPGPHWCWSIHWSVYGQKKNKSRPQISSPTLHISLPAVGSRWRSVNRHLSISPPCDTRRGSPQPIPDHNGVRWSRGVSVHRSQQAANICMRTAVHKEYLSLPVYYTGVSNCSGTTIPIMPNQICQCQSFARPHGTCSSATAGGPQVEHACSRV